MSEQISQFLQERIDGRDFPSAVFLVAEKGEIVLHEALGYAVTEPERIEAHNDTIYDLASLTKVLVTGLLVARLVEAGRFPTDGRVSSYLTEFDSDEKRAITISSLLSHSSHLPAWLPFYLLVENANDVMTEIGRTPLNFKQSPVTYSDLNFIALGSLIEIVANQSLDVLFREDVSEPLGLTSTFFCPPPSLKQHIAASEAGNCFERQTCIDLGYPQPAAAGDGKDVFRTDLIWGEVHDNNAYFMGGVAGHAGLFSTAEEVFKIAQQFLPSYTSLLAPETCELFRTNLTPDTNEHRSFAFQLASTTDSTAGMKMPPESFGHLGFTGTSLWIDPVKDRVFILLTNRTHSRELPFANINLVRRRFHDLAIDHLDRIS